MQLDSNLLKEIAALLNPLMKSEPERRALLVQAFGVASPLLDDIDYGGSTRAFVLSIIQRLADYGEVGPGRPALWALLETVRDGGLVGADRQRRIDALHEAVLAGAAQYTRPAPVDTAIDADRTYFVGHALTPENIEDLRPAIVEALQPSGCAPYFPDKFVIGKTRLRARCEQIFLSGFGVFDISAGAPDVYLELGIALGMNRPAIVLAREKAYLPDVLDESAILRYTGYADLKDKLAAFCEQFTPEKPDGVAEYCYFCNRVCNYMSLAPDANTYLVLDNSKILYRDLMDQLKPHIARRRVHPIFLTDFSVGPKLCQLRKKVLTCQFVVAHLGALANPDCYLALGMAIGSRVPWLVLHKQDGDAVPRNLQGLDMVVGYLTLAGLRRDYTEALDNFLDIVLPHTSRAGGKTVKWTTFWGDLEDWIIKITHVSLLDETVEGRLRVIRYRGKSYIEKYSVHPGGLHFGRDPDLSDVVLVDSHASRRHFRIAQARNRRYYVEDLDSTNGTMLNGRLLLPGERAEVMLQDNIKVKGGSEYFVIWDDRPPPGEDKPELPDTDSFLVET